MCPTGNCGLEMLPGEVRLSPYQDHDNGDPTTDQHTATISLSVLLIAGVAIVLVVIYYRRRLSVVRKDLQNRYRRHGLMFSLLTNQTFLQICVLL